MENSAEKDQFVKRLLVICAVITLIILAVIGVSYIVDILMLVFAAVLVAVFLRGLADLINERLGISEGKAVLLVSVLLILFLAGSIALLAPSVAEQIRNLRDEMPRSMQNVVAYLSKYGWGRAILEHTPTMPTFDEIWEYISTSSFLTSVGGFFSTTAGMITNFFVAILLAVYLAAEPKLYTEGFTKLFPIEKRGRVHEILAQIGDTLRWWLIGKIGSMFAIGILTWIGLSIIGVPLALTLGLIAGLFSFIPNFGPILSAIPAILLAFIDSPITSVYVIGLYIFVQLIESNLITPWIERQTVELPPGLTITAQLILAVLIGGMGLVLATPILAVVMVLIQMVYIQDILGDRNVEVEQKNSGEDESEEDFQRKDAKAQIRKDSEITDTKIKGE